MPNLDIPGKIIEIGERLEADHIVIAIGLEMLPKIYLFLQILKVL